MSSKKNDALLVIEGREDKMGNTVFQVLSRGGKNGVIEKTVSYTQLMKLLSRSYKEDIVSLKVGEIPEGYLDGTLATDGSGSILLYVESKKRSFLLRVDGQKFPVGFIIPMPAMVFDIQYSKNGTAHGNCCIVQGTYEEVKSAYLRGGLQGYLYPFGNVSSSGGICMGSIPVKVTSLMQAQDFVEAFFDGITNHHYMDDSRRVMNGMGQMELLGALNGKDEFPIEWLVKSDFSFLKRSNKKTA